MDWKILFKEFYPDLLNIAIAGASAIGSAVILKLVARGKLKKGYADAILMVLEALTKDDSAGASGRLPIGHEIKPTAASVSGQLSHKEETVIQIAEAAQDVLIKNKGNATNWRDHAEDIVKAALPAILEEAKGRVK